ncbi:uncharacterized protein LOC114851333 isoform X2 [Betta splendens]|uniref:Uncharacterized protein LOC114851333 isoform X2 n=1 Tax=Betta splendens TaxID=158456 RepID=A0A8M1HBI6_BETSP|nr:uncharacterized protein LOC114851333 isoform X2 [Betta splendens]
MAPPAVALCVACLLMATSGWGKSNLVILSSFSYFLPFNAGQCSHPWSKCSCACSVLSSADVTELKPSTASRFVSVNLGQDVTLTCSFEDSVAVMFYWYKQTLGGKPEVVSKFYKHEKNATLMGPFKSDPRFQVDMSAGKKHLKISSVQSSDSATYFCVGGYSYLFEFVESVFLAVVHSGSNAPALVHQSVSGSIQPGGSVTLNCTVQTWTCDGQHSVYWFKDSGEARPGIIYTHGDRNDQCERTPDTQTHTCVYKVQIKHVDRSHAGTYYCAVASCGQILFGNGTKLDLEYQDSHLVNALSSALWFTSLLSVLLAFLVCKMVNNQFWAEPHAGLSAPPTKNAKTEINRRGTKGDTWTECVYFSVRADGM